MLAELKTATVDGIKEGIHNQIDENEPVLSWLPVFTDIIAEIYPFGSATPKAPSSEQLFDAINPFPSSASIRTSAECGVCRWGTWVLRELLGNRVTHDFLVGGGRALCPFFIGEAGFVRATCQGIIDQQWGESILPFITDDFLSEEVFCTYKMEVCNMDEYQEIDLK